jgi:hypothetical protein
MKVTVTWLDGSKQSFLAADEYDEDPVHNRATFYLAESGKPVVEVNLEAVRFIYFEY